MSTALRCAGLGHRYGRSIWGLRDCNLDVPAGSVVALVGPNGSGKTTLMSMATSLLPASTKTIEHGMNGVKTTRSFVSDYASIAEKCDLAMALAGMQKHV